MQLMPKRVKFRKQQRGKLRGKALRGNYVAYGDYGLQCLGTDLRWVGLHHFGDESPANGCWPVDVLCKRGCLHDCSGFFDF